ncbi:MAG TPA: YihY/virulence factor BrkB family protein [Pyrinomonadaceae bacterium]|nr:YihY/virulence factor BrkB family protein [Pyrinomonadaceae bacterium]
MLKSLSLGGLGWKELAKRVWAEASEDDVLGRAAQLAYYFLLALFPALLFLVSLIGYFAGEDSELRADLFRYLSTVLPGEASQLVDDTVRDVTQGSGGGKLSFGILATLWAASNGMGAISEALNVAYDVKETRPWWKARLVAVGLTLALAFLIISALVLVLYGHSLAEWVAVAFGLGHAFELTWKVVQWPIVLLFVLLAFALIYYFAPSVRDQDWKWVTPGSLVAVVLWLLVSFGFKFYLNLFNSYSATYGTLGAVIILMLWFYLTGAAILVGGEINSEVEHEMAKQGAPDAKEKGEKSPGGRKERATTASRRGKTAAPEKGSAGGRDAARSFSVKKLAVVLGARALGMAGLGARKSR